MIWLELVIHSADICVVAPHIGHLHTLVLTDTFARFARLRNPDREVLFNTGTDEHGMKIQQAAKAAGIGEQEFCDGVSERFRVGIPRASSRRVKEERWALIRQDLARRSGMSNTSFIRTSEQRHHDAVKHFWVRSDPVQLGLTGEPEC